MLTFWIIAISLTVVACLAILLPVLRSRPQSDSSTSYDIEVYRDQLSEVDADETRGLIGAREAAEARAEIGRRILRTNEEADPVAAMRGTTTRWLALIAVASIPLLSWGTYAFVGSPDLPGQPLQARLDKDPAENTIEELIVRAETHLAQNPEDARGWDVIAPIYVRVRRYQDAVNAYRNAIRIGGNDARRLSGLGEALSAANRGAITPAARRAFLSALELEPRNSKALFFTAMADAQAGRINEAVSRWQALADNASEQSPWRNAALNAIEATKARADAGDTARQPGPDAEDLAAAENMTAEDRGAMIESMVASLAAKLEENPLDREGWQRLVRSYLVLGKQDEAKAALERGKAALGGTPAAVDALTEFAAGLGLVETE